MSGDEAWGNFAEDREHKYVVGLRVSAAERLEWLEEMLELAFARGALPRPRDAWGERLSPVEAARR